MSTDRKFTPRYLTAPEYVLELFAPDDNAAILARNRSTGHTVQAIAKAESIASPDFQSWLANQNAAGSDVFVGMNPIKDGAHSRTKASLGVIRHVYLDLDRKGDESLEAIRNSTEVPPPNFVLDTSPGKHQVVWKVHGFSREEAESLLHDLANKFGGDLAATDSTRVLRLPGFANRKVSPEFIIQASHQSDAVHSPRDFAISEDSREAPPHLGKRASMPAGHRSQSESDWAYAKRALARGDPPEQVIRRITDYRGNEKHPGYARRTVEKAQSELQREAKPSRSNAAMMAGDLEPSREK